MEGGEERGLLVSTRWEDVSVEEEGTAGRGRGTYSRERSCSVRWSTAARAWREIASTSISAGVAVRCGVGVGGRGAQDAGASRGCCGRG